MRRSFEEFQKINAALAQAKSQLGLAETKTPYLDEATQNYLHALSHATQIEENILRITLNNS